MPRITTDQYGQIWCPVEQSLDINNESQTISTKLMIPRADDPFVYLTAVLNINGQKVKTTLALVIHNNVLSKMIMHNAMVDECIGRKD